MDVTTKPIVNTRPVFAGQIGIDLGTTYSCVAFWNKDHVEIITNFHGDKTTPSWVAFTETDILIGRNAKEQAAKNSRNTIFGVKRLMGKRFSDETVQDDLEQYPYEVTRDVNDIPTIVVNYKGIQRSFKPEQISALILEHMKKIAEERLGQRVTKAVITVPAYFDDSQRTATKHAATIAGLECEKIINEPTAACMCYGLDKREENTKVLIFDLGGGTFDVSILNLHNGIFEVLSVAGDTHLGGEDFDHVIFKGVIEDFKTKHKLAQVELSAKVQGKLKAACEAAKKVLSEAQRAEIEIENFYDGKDLSYVLTRNKFELWCAPYFKRCIEPVKNALEAASLDSDQIKDIVLVGGSTRIPKVQQILSEFFNRERSTPVTLNKSVNPDEAVAYGAAVQGAILSNTDESGRTKDLLLMDVTPLSLGIETMGGRMSKIIQRNTSIPVKVSKVYSTVEDRQTAVSVRVFEGEREFTKDNHKIADFDLVDIPPQPKQVPKIEVTFEIDRNGILLVRATDKATGENNEIKVSDSTRLSQEEINQMIEEAEQFRADDALKVDSLNSRNMFEKELLFTQQCVNQEDLVKSDDGAAILTEEEISWLNQFILNNLTWLEDGEDLTKARIEEAKEVFLRNTKALMSRLFARKKQVDLSRKYAEQEPTQEDVLKLVTTAFEPDGENVAVVAQPVASGIKAKHTMVAKEEPPQPQLCNSSDTLSSRAKPTIKVKLEPPQPPCKGADSPTAKVKHTVKAKAVPPSQPCNSSDGMSSKAKPTIKKRVST